MDWSVTLLLIFVLAIFHVYGQSCRNSRTLGMASGEIRNSSITASSFESGFEPYLGRLHTDRRHGAWCPAGPVLADSYEWLQVDFEEMVSITHLRFSGEFNDGEGTRYARKFRIEYQRTEDDDWHQYVNDDNTQIFDGNKNTRTADFLHTNGLLICSRIRVIPVAELRDDVCMNLEFYGCRLSGIATYTVPQGDSRGDRYDFTDHFYDGQISGNTLTDGLGLLTNQTLGNDTFNVSPFDWLGWRNDARSNVVLLFELDHLRNISKVKIHSNNQWSKDVRVFRQANIYTNIDSADYDDKVAHVYEFNRDTTSEDNRQVEIPLNHVVAKYVKVMLEFDAKWIMISEVTFVSELVVGQYPTDTTVSTAASVIPTSTTTRRHSSVPTTTPHAKIESTMFPFQPPDDLTTRREVVVDGRVTQSPETDKQLTSINGGLIGIIVGSCVGVILVVVLIIIVCCVYQRKKAAAAGGNNSSSGGDSVMSIPQLHKPPPSHLEPSDYDLPWGSGGRPLPHPPPNGATLQSSGYHSDGAQYACIPIEQYNNCQQMTTMSPQPCMRHYMTSGGLLTLPGVHHDRHQCNNMVNRPVNTLPANAHNNLLIPVNNKGPPGYDRNQYDLVQQDNSPFDSSNYRSSPTVPLPNIQSSTGSSVYGIPANSHLEEHIPNVSYDSLRFLEKLGSGQYGEVHLCQMSDPNDKDTPRLVAIKKLQPAANAATKADFIREIKIMSKLRHDNIIQVLGVCSSTSSADSPCVVTEYMSRGDLHQFLQKHVPEGTNLLNKQTLGQSTLLYIASQISQGMRYLEQLNVTHRDLAARNCLVGDNYQVKISDFGMSRSLYSSQYYKVEGRVVLPIRWMAWESVLLGKFTTKSDVWSFGVTLWEIFSFAREQPFSVLPDDDVIANCMHYYHNKMAEVTLLSQPSQCTKEIYDLMRACWNQHDINRPTFNDISSYLCRKSPSAVLPDNSTPERRPSLTRLTAC